MQTQTLSINPLSKKIVKEEIAVFGSETPTLWQKFVKYLILVVFSPARALHATAFLELLARKTGTLRAPALHSFGA